MSAMSIKLSKDTSEAEKQIKTAVLAYYAGKSVVCEISFEHTLHYYFCLLLSMLSHVKLVTVMMKSGTAVEEEKIKTTFEEFSNFGKTNKVSFQFMWDTEESTAINGVI